jgi:hypothetical protein
MTLDIQILRKLDEANFRDLQDCPQNMVDISIQDRSYYIARDITTDDVELAIKRIEFFIFADERYKPGEYIHRLILNRSSTITLDTERLIAPCIYLLPMVYLGRLSRGEYSKVHNNLSKKSTFRLNDTNYQLFKDITRFYDMNSGQLGILSYLY